MKSFIMRVIIDTQIIVPIHLLFKGARVFQPASWRIRLRPLSRGNYGGHAGKSALRYFKDPFHFETICKTAIALSLLQLFCCQTQADSIVTDTGTVTGTVQTITAAEVKLGDGKSIPVNTVQKIEFDLFAVAPKQSGIVLKEGSMLTGIVRETGENLNFRSTDFGEMKIRIQSVAVVFMDLDLWTKFAGKKLNAPCLVDKSETVYAGKIMWQDAKSAGVMTEDGLKKIPSEDIGFICYAPSIKAAKVILRNGDVVNFDKEFAGNTVTFIFDDRKFSIPLKAVREINIR